MKYKMKKLETDDEEMLSFINCTQAGSLFSLRVKPKTTRRNSFEKVDTHVSAVVNWVEELYLVSTSRIFAIVGSADIVIYVS